MNVKRVNNNGGVGLQDTMQVVNDIILRAINAADVPAVKEPWCLNRQDGKCPLFRGTAANPFCGMSRCGQGYLTIYKQNNNNTVKQK